MSHAVKDGAHFLVVMRYDLYGLLAALSTSGLRMCVFKPSLNEPSQSMRDGGAITLTVMQMLGFSLVDVSEIVGFTRMAFTSAFIAVINR